MQKSSEGIDQEHDSIEDNVQDFAEDTTPTNKRFPKENDYKKKVFDYKSKLLQRNYHINNLSFRKLKALETLVNIPRMLQNVQPPKFPDYRFRR